MKKVETGKAIGYGWESIKKDFWYWIVITIISMAASFISYIDDKSMVLAIASALLSIYISIGLCKLILSYISGNKLPIVDIFKQYKYFWRALGASILVGLIVILGMILLIVPGIYWALKYQFVVYLIIDKDLGISEAMKKSAEMTKGIKWSLFGFSIVILGVIILGALALGVGLLVAVPVASIAQVKLYKMISGGSEKAEVAPESA